MRGIGGSPSLPNPPSRRALLIAGLFAAILFVGAVASNLIASDLEETLKPYRRWVWLMFAVALVVAVVAAIVEARRDRLSVPNTVDEKTGTVHASSERSVAIGGKVEDSTIVTGDKNVVGSKVEGDANFRDKITYNIQQAASTVVNPLHQVPPPPADFTGRAKELEELLVAIEQGGVTISGLRGLGGIGKTALALKLVEQLKPRYPDAQFYLDLKGASPQPLSAAEALAHLVRAYHPAAKLPESESELRALYLSLLDSQRAIILMDNAATAEQIEPLIPPASCVLLVTSRQHFVLPGLVAKNLDTLNEDEARALLFAIAPRIGAWAEEIAALCGHLPLALRLAAGALAKYVNLKPEDYARRLQDQQPRLQLIEASLSLSYELLSEELRQRWRWLAVFADSFADDAAAAVWQVEVDEAQQMLGELITTSLVEWDEATGRYRLHDLARLFADAKLSPEERTIGMKRHATHYKDVLLAADNLYREGGVALARGLALFDLEFGNIQAGHAWVTAQVAELEENAVRLGMDYPLVGMNILFLRQHVRERIRWSEIAVMATQRLKDRAKESSALGNLGLAYLDLGESKRAIELFQQALLIVREISDRGRECRVLNNLGLAHAEQGETQGAITVHEQQLTIAREIGDRRLEGYALGNLGRAYAQLHEMKRALQFFEQNLTIARELGDIRDEGISLGNLGLVYAHLGETQRALQFYDQQLTIMREIGDRSGEGIALGNIGLGLERLGKRAQAIQHAEQSLAIFEHIEDPRAATVREQLAAWRGESGHN